MKRSELTKIIESLVSKEVKKQLNEILVKLGFPFLVIV